MNSLPINGLTKTQKIHRITHGLIESQLESYLLCLFR